MRFLSFRLVRKRKEKGSKGERKELRERETRSSSGGVGDGASTADGFPGTLDIRVMTIY